MTFSEARQATKHTRVIVAVQNSLHCLNGADGMAVWSYDAKNVIKSSPAVGDVVGDESIAAVIGTINGELHAVDTSSGQPRWVYRGGSNILSSPALARRSGGVPYRKEWPMFRHDAARTGFYGHTAGPLDVYFTCSDGSVVLVSGRDGTLVDRFSIKFPVLVGHASTPGDSMPQLPFYSSPSIADLDGDGLLDIVFLVVDRVWCLTDRRSGGGAIARPKPTGRPHLAASAVVRRDRTPGFSSFLWAQIIHRGDWGPDERAYSTLLNELSKRINLDVVSAKTNVSLLDKDLSAYPFLYLTGHYAHGLADEEIANLRGHLQRGGFLFADACCGSEKFDGAFRALAQTLFPDAPLKQIPLNHEIFGVFYKCEKMKYHKIGETTPFLEGVTVDDRLVIVYSKYDIGCAWAHPPCSKGCLAGDNEDSVKLTTNIVVYAMTK
jgi:hypothetical protein